MKEKMLMSLERDRHVARAEATRAVPPKDVIPAVHKPASKPRTTARDVASPSAPPPASLLAEPRCNPLAALEFEAAPVAALACAKVFKGHMLGVANVALHPRKPVVATASDDKTWHLWHLPDGALIMSGEGHRDWVSGIDFHPRGACLASSSGDATVKIWDFERQCCSATFKDHNAAVWAVAFHDQGDFLASCSLDHSIRLWDLGQGVCRQVGVGGYGVRLRTGEKGCKIVRSLADLAEAPRAAGFSRARGLDQRGGVAVHE